jgi:hypothetical protein
LESVSTCWPPTLISATVLPPAAAEEAEAGADAAALLLAEAAGVLAAVLELLPELPQADMVSARPASPATPSIVRISDVSPSQCTWSPVRNHGREGKAVQWASELPFRARLTVRLRARDRCR